MNEQPLLLPVAEFFVPVLDDADGGGRHLSVIAFLDRCRHHESLAVGGDVVTATGASGQGQVGRCKEQLGLPQGEALFG